MYLLDTNVISEMRKARLADPRVHHWSRSSHAELKFISVVTLYELEIGVLRMERRDPAQGVRLRQWLNHQILPTFNDRIFLIDQQVALLAASKHVPDPRSERDSYIAATALVHNMTVVTRNVRDFEGMGVRIVNPWES
jgi:toxin FitB